MHVHSGVVHGGLMGRRVEQADDERGGKAQLDEFAPRPQRVVLAIAVRLDSNSSGCIQRSRPSPRSSSAQQRQASSQAQSSSRAEIFAVLAPEK